MATDVNALIAKVSARTGVDPRLLRQFVDVESGGNPLVRTGSYKGLMQLSDVEFKKHGGTGSIFDPEANLMAGARKIRTEQDQFRQSFGRDPSATELYMVHQQGVGGSAAHLRNPEGAAWQNMASTAEGREKGAEWAKRAIWGNIPDAEKKRLGSVENVTSRDFVDLWDARLQRTPESVKNSRAPARPSQAVSPRPAIPPSTAPLMAGIGGPSIPPPSPASSLPFGLAPSTPKPVDLSTEQVGIQPIQKIKPFGVDPLVMMQQLRSNSRYFS